MKPLQFARTHNNAANLEDFVHQPEITKHLDFSVEYTANGVAKRIGGGTMEVRWAYLTREELIDLLNQFGVSHRAPSTQGTFLVPDWFSIPSIMNGQITIETPDEGDGFFQNVTAKITGLAYI